MIILLLLLLLLLFYVDINFIDSFLQLADIFFVTSLSFIFCQLSLNNVVLCNSFLTQTFILLVQCM